MRILRHEFGIGLIDVVVTLVVVLIMLGMAIPAMDDIDRAEAAKAIVGCVHRVEEACLRHLSDTGRVALEFSAPAAGHPYNADRYHHLAKRQSYHGWDGPYLDQPLSAGDSPFGAPIFLMGHLDDTPAAGFVVEGARLHGSGQYLVFEGIPEAIARRVDEQLDEDESGPWQGTGRVEYADQDGGRLSVFLTSAP